jgi:hypothetical protein
MGRDGLILHPTNVDACLKPTIEEAKHELGCDGNKKTKMFFLLFKDFFSNS